jgi:hypothetical protein
MGVDPDRYPWAPWTPAEVASRLAGVDVPWYVAAGWALDLFLGEQRRPHEDLEIGVPASRFGEVAAALPGVDWYQPEDGLLHRLAPGRDTHQTWALDPVAGTWRLDVFREPDDGEWVCRRDAAIRLPYGELIERTPGGIPYGRPEVVLLFKAKAHRPKDEEDLAAVLPHLDASRRAWLAGALERVHPGHPWLVPVGAG